MFVERLPGTFRSVQLPGGFHLVWRGMLLVRSASAGGPGTLRAVQPPVGITPGNAYRAGFPTNMSNPKTLAFAASLFATPAVHAQPWIGLVA